MKNDYFVLIETFDHQKIKSANGNDVILESDIGKLSNELGHIEGVMADLSVQINQAQHEQVIVIHFAIYWLAVVSA